MACSGRIDRDVTENMEIDLIRRCTADLGTCHVYPHSAQVLAYSCAAQGNRM